MSSDTYNDADLSPLVSGTMEKGQRNNPRKLHGREGFLFLSASQVVGLFIAAFILGASCPLLVVKLNLKKTRQENQAHACEPTVVPKLSNNLRLFSRHFGTTTTTTTTSDGISDNPVAANTSGVKLAWLMSFPNSGTSYTLDLVHQASDMSVATNYGKGNAKTPVVPVLASAQSDNQGPFWLNPLGKLPHVVAFTKTHCGGYCHDCAPSDSVETPSSFLRHCATAEVEHFDASEPNKVKHDFFVYEYSDVDRAVHLFRAPFDNMVSRYHLMVHSYTRHNRTDLIARYTYDAVGYNNFCSDITDVDKERSDSHVDPDALRLIEDIPCHFDLFRYIQWHDLAFIITDDYLTIPTHILHYEDYSTDFNATLQGLLDFLELPNAGGYADFVTGKSYRDYYTEEQIARMRTATMMLASPATWHAVERYF